MLVSNIYTISIYIYISDSITILIYSGIHTIYTDMYTYTYIYSYITYLIIFTEQVSVSAGLSIVFAIYH